MNSKNIDFDLLKKSIEHLETAANMPLNKNRFEIDATIYRFKLTIDFFWKTLKKILLDDYGLEVNGLKSVLQQAYAHKLINDEAMWLNILDDLSLAPQAYNDDVANKIYHNIKIYVPFLKKEVEHVKNC